MAGTASPGDFEPIATINTTPLIDLMLVLLIMFIISIPPQTHKVPVDLPTPGTPAEPSPVHRLDIAANGALLWDGRAIADVELAPRLAGLVADPARPVLHIAADAETRYERFDEALAAVRGAGITRLGFVGNHRFADAIAG